MIRDAFLPLPLIPLVDGASVFRQAQSLPERVTLESPALEVMTDLKQVTALTTEPEASVEDANAKMIRNGVRLLFVTDPQHRLQGLITATDILGEKVLQAMQERGVARRDVLVHEIMTPRMRLEAIDMHEVRGAKVGHVLVDPQAGRPPARDRGRDPPAELPRQAGHAAARQRFADPPRLVLHDADRAPARPHSAKRGAGHYVCGS